MDDKKIIEKKNVKENNPNDDEEVLKNNDTQIDQDTTNRDAKQPKSKNEAPQDPEITGIS